MENTKVEKLIKKYEIEKADLDNTANSKWSEGVDYWYNLSKPIPCVVSYGTEYKRGFCEVINVFHHQSDDENRVYIIYCVKFGANTKIDDIDEYMLATTRNRTATDPIQLKTLSNLNKSDFIELEKYLFEKTYELHKLKEVAV